MQFSPAPQPRAKTTKPAAPPLSYSLAAAEAASGLSRSTLYRHAAAGRLQTVLVGGRRLVVGTSLRALVGAEG